MNWKLCTTGSFTLAMVVALGCTNVYPTTLNINTTGGGGSGGEGGGDSSTTDGPATSTGVGTGGAAPGKMAKAFYLSTVDAQIQGTCSACHATGLNGAPIFLASTAEGSYNAMDQFGGLVVAPENSLLLLHGAHTGPAPTAAQKDLVTTWLTMEAEERGLLGSMTTSSSSGGAPGPMTLQQALADYGACMDITEWTANNLDKLASAQTLNNGPCKGCHGAGDGGNWLSANTQETFDMNRKFPYIKRSVTGTVDGDGNFKDLIASNRFVAKGTEPCQPNTNCHPSYVLPPQLQDGLDAFVTGTIDKWHQKLCSAKMP